jgi:hypothetical protein
VQGRGMRQEGYVGYRQRQGRTERKMGRDEMKVEGGQEVG